MKTFEKNYIGKGKQVAEMQIVKIHCRIEDLLENAHEYKGEDWITFEVSKLQNPDKFGNTHTVYVNKLIEAPQGVSEPQKKAPVKTSKAAKTSKKSKTKSDDNPDLPF